MFIVQIHVHPVPSRPWPPSRGSSITLIFLLVRWPSIYSVPFETRLSRLDIKFLRGDVVGLSLIP